MLKSKYHSEIQNSVSSKTFAVIVKSIDVENSKVVKAKNMNIPIYTIDSFIEKFKLDINNN